MKSPRRFPALLSVILALVASGSLLLLTTAQALTEWEFDLDIKIDHRCELKTHFDRLFPKIPLTPENARSLGDSEPSVSEPEPSGLCEINVSEPEPSGLCEINVSAPEPSGLYEITENPPSSADPLQAFGKFAWETFVALNWPADCSGSPLTEKEIGQDSQAPRVWEFYNYPEDIFKPNGKKPDPESVIPPQCQNGQVVPIARKLRLTENRSNPTLETMDGETNFELPFGYVLVDRAGNYVINERRMNTVEVDQIVENGWYSANRLAALNFNNDVSGSYANPFELMCSSQKDYYYPTSNHPLAPCRENKTEGAIEIKAAWMVLPENTDDNDRELPEPKRYYTTERTFLVETPEREVKPVTVPVALIGFHILHKTSVQGWIWSTFEHIDNAPDPNQQGSDGLECYTPPELSYYNLYDPKSHSPVNTPLAIIPYLWRDEFPHAVTEKDGKIVEQERSNITRQVCIPSVAADLNEAWQKKLEGFDPTSVWKNYQLIGVQWLKQPYDPYSGGRDVFPKRLINVALEPYPQKVPEEFIDKFPDAGFSCISCHTAATLSGRDKKIKADFSFLMSHAK